jgi:hypothetical protein
MASTSYLSKKKKKKKKKRKEREKREERRERGGERERERERDGELSEHFHGVRVSAMITVRIPEYVFIYWSLPEIKLKNFAM